MSKHSPGPWLHSGTESSVNFTEVQLADGTRKGRLATSVCHHSRPGFPMIRVGATSDDPVEVVANARLIAAAPDLLEAAKLALRVAESWVYDQLSGTDELGVALAKLGPIRSAIAKAEGGEA